MKAPDDFWPEDEDLNPDPDTLCPNCLQDYVDPASFYGFCPRCTEQRPRALSKDRQARWAPNTWRHANGERMPEVDFSNARLPRLERVIQTGLRSFIAVGSALRAIRDRRLYRDAGYRSFETYCQQRWGFGRDYADRQIAAAVFISALTSEEPLTGVGIMHEGHVRELARLDIEEAREVWAELAGTYPPNLITGTVVKAEVDRRLGTKGESAALAAPAIEARCPACGTWHLLVETRSASSAERAAV